MSAEIYFDNNATTRIAPEVFEAMRPYLTEFYGNPSSIHRFGSQVGRKLDEARRQVAGLIGASDPVVWAPWKTPAESIVAPEGIEQVPEERVIEALERLRVVR